MVAAGWSSPGAVPISPQNGQVVSPYIAGMLDLRWDDPSVLTRNTPFTIVGVNIYRSDASQQGPYRRINEFPVGGTFFRDQATSTWISKEVIQWNSHWLFKGDAPNDRKWMFRTRSPITKRFITAPQQAPNFANAPADVVLHVNGVEVPVSDVFGPNGEVTLINAPAYDIATEKFELPALPRGPEDVVEISYRTVSNVIPSGLDKHVWYRFTSVALDADTPSGYIETPLRYAEPHSVIEVESLDYIWREAMRRNAWILGCGGERVRIFIRKCSGIPCDCCIEPRTLEYSKQPSSRCLVCFHTGFIGGYEGPFEGILAPDDAERRISQSGSGRRKEHSYEVWTGPSPLLTMRDFVVKQTNERYSIGAVRRPTHRGNLLQQHFTIAYFDQGDIRYRVPMDGTTNLPWPETRGGDYPPEFNPRPVDAALEGNPNFPGAGDGQWPTGTDNDHPMLTEKVHGTPTPDGLERRGRTKVWENTEY